MSRGPSDTRLEFPRFEPRAPWWGPDLQTLRNTLRRPRPRVGLCAGQRLVLPLADGSGDALSGLLECPGGSDRRPLAVLVHGLGGSEDSAYLKVSCAHLLARGHPVLRLNLRGAGPSRTSCRWQYHAGRSADLRDALNALDDLLLGSLRRGLFLIGYSLGANMLLKFLSEHGRSFPIHGAVSVSAPIDLQAAQLRLMAPRNWLYHRYLLRRMKREACAPAAELTEDERDMVLGCRSVLEFDDCFTAPRNGFLGAGDYYARCSARRFLSGILTPTLAIHARNDPWIPAEPYLSFDWSRAPEVRPLLPASGGHVGFHGVGGPARWSDRIALAFLRRLLGRHANAAAPRDSRVAE